MNFPALSFFSKNFMNLRIKDLLYKTADMPLKIDDVVRKQQWMASGARTSGGTYDR